MSDELQEGCYASPGVFEKAFSKYLDTIAQEIKTVYESGQQITGKLAVAAEHAGKARQILKETPHQLAEAKGNIFLSVNALIGYASPQRRHALLKTVRQDCRPMLDGPMPGRYIDSLVIAQGYDSYKPDTDTQIIAEQGELEGRLD